MAVYVKLCANFFFNKTVNFKIVTAGLQKLDKCDKTHCIIRNLHSSLQKESYVTTSAGNKTVLDSEQNYLQPTDSSKNELYIKDVSHYASSLPPTHNFAAYVNDSPLLQEFVKLGVKLYKFEKNRELAEYILKLNFDKNVKPHLMFLHDVGVPDDNLGDFITKNPLIFKEDLNNLKVRINYLLSKRFTAEDVTRIVSVNPHWLSFTTKEIDYRLGHFQFEFKLRGDEVRYLTVKQPTLITYKMNHIKLNIFSFKEEMGFSQIEMKSILLNKPKLLKKCNSHLVNRFAYVHNTMKISHDMITKQPDILNSRLFRLKQRHEFLTSLKRAQYDPTQPGYVSLKSLVGGNDSEFCNNVAKVPVETFNLFLKAK